MAVIIGSATQVTLSIPGGGTISCALSVNWSYNPNVQRYYCLGSTAPYISVTKPTEQMSIALYSGDTPSYSVLASTDCDDTDLISATVSPGQCAGDPISGPISTTWYLQNYGFSKDDPNLPGQETWALTNWLGATDTGDTDAVRPDRVIRSVAEGQASDPSAGDADPGVSFTGTTHQATTGNVSAGQVGRADTLLYGTAESVGNSGQIPSPAAQYGRTGQGSVSIPLQPVWF